jgi:phosphatidylglycerophosphatase A
VTAVRPLDRLALVLAKGFGAGSVPVAPGTAGTAVAIPLTFLTAGMSTPAYLALCVAVTAVAIWAADRADIVMGTHDSGSIVVDEIAGYMVTMAWVDRGDWILLAAGFVVFRVADVVKPWPARWLERCVPGGAGVVLDDVAAGLIGSLVVAAMSVTDLQGHLAAAWG